ncbi:sensor histidine kinase [Paenibacillus lemnae]|uniref:histidine kinase n=1 Tax=Paenibacillus lemnae TaxID=1330551 RepID=A0A848M4N9_PAELE|nr:sensor histidine kinase [Paenibacillus lemnae]NMO96048.1 HAMP domain-containing histidine kinase [Paenibacillus lemnae]
MAKKYLREKKSWIAFFVLLQLFTLLIAYLDTTVPLGSLVYMIFLSSLLFAGFLIWRYHVETGFYKQLESWDTAEGAEALPEAGSPFEAIVDKTVKDMAEAFTRESSERMTALELEKDDLLSWIHEVKTPLTTMQLMIGRVEDEKLKGALNYEWLRIHLLLDQQLHQKRLPFMSNDLYIESASLTFIIHGEIKSLQSWCMQKGIGFELSLDAQQVLTDAKWLGFMIRQLLTNAVKYSQESDIVIQSRCVGERTVLEIRDHGRGIPARDLPRIFERGFTSTLDHQNHASTGMGLYLVSKAAQPLHINIDVKSTPGEGTAFTLTFPAKNSFHHIQGV